VHHATLQAEDTVVIAQIQALQPGTMSWSNISDYMTPLEFHSMAAACGSPQHYLHVMNWFREVKGARVMDYSTLDSEGVDCSTVAQVKERCMLFRTGLRVLQAGLAERKLSSVLRSPPFTHCMNIVDPMLGAQFAPLWIKAFEQAAPSSTVALVELLHGPQYWEQARMDSTLYLRLHYK
jgi:hypothetical protein